MGLHQKSVRRARRRRWPLRFWLIGILVAVLATVRSTNAVFTSRSSSTGNRLGAGTVAITDNDGGSALFSTASLLPGDSATVCTGVSYTGSVTSAPIRLFVDKTAAQESDSGAVYGAWADSTASMMDDNLTMRIEVSSNDLAASPGSNCNPAGVGSFTDVAGTFGTNMRTLIATNYDFATGLVSQWGTVVPNTWRVWRFTYTFSLAATAAAQSDGLKCAFTWAAQK
ncbi:MULTISPECIES: hypothetical protein [unclassified Actinoplanes]|uniref:hypothetical protein n=1 Tax=unclassified Actinoplanes TaxID=2626549 RepID=UPI0005BD6E03|nr:MULTISPECIES: hypothetical protein [unclassified Actinoplanes]